MLAPSLMCWFLTNVTCRFDLEYNEVVIVETGKLHDATGDVMRSHGVPHAMSADLRTAGLGSWPTA